MKPIATLPFQTELVPEHAPDYTPEEISQLFREKIQVYHCEELNCECKGMGACDTAAGICYGTDENTGLLCPRHFYEYLFGPNRSHTLIEPIETN